MQKGESDQTEKKKSSKVIHTKSRLAKKENKEEETRHAPVGEDEPYAEAAKAEQEGPFPGDGAPEQKLLPSSQHPCCSPALVKAHLLS